MPEQRKGESDRDYVNRVKDAWRTERAAHVKEVQDKDREILETKSLYRSDKERDAYIKKMESELSSQKEEMLGIEHEFGSVQNAVQKARTLDYLNYGIQNHPDEKLAIEASNTVSQLVNWAEKDIQKKKIKQKTEALGQNSESEMSSRK